jgi:hypothetical protein
MSLTGGCHCGAIRYEVEGDALTHLGPAGEARPDQVQRWVKQIKRLGAQAV